MFAPADQDTWLKESSPDEAQGDNEELSARSQADDNMRPLLRFDLSDAPGGAIVESAILRFLITSEQEGSDPVNVRRITADWEEATATWNTTASDYDGSTIYGQFTPSSAGEATVDVTDLVQAWIAGTVPNYGLMFLPTLEETETKYASREWSTPSQRPVLEIVFGSSGLSADLAIDKSVDKATANPGETLVYTITVTNHGPEDASGVSVLDQIPSELSLQDVDASQGSYDSETGIWQVGSVANGNSATLTLTTLIL